MTPEQEKATFDKVARRLIPFLFLCYVVAFLDRVNVGFAKLQMAPDLGFSDQVFGFGAGVFFLGYFLFEVPSNVILERVGARRWIARIMVTWGLISSLFMFTGDVPWRSLGLDTSWSDAEFTFYLLRFLLGVSEAGFFPGIILYLTYWFPARRRATVVALFMTAIALSNVIGAPLSGAIMQYLDGQNGWRGWQWMFLLEGLPSLLVGLLVLKFLPDSPARASFLSQPEKDMIAQRIEEEEKAKSGGPSPGLAQAFKDSRVWALGIVYFCGLVCFYAINFWIPTIISELGLQPTDFFKIGLLTTLPWGGAAIAMVAWGAHSDRTGERRWHASGGLFVGTAGLLWLAVAGHSIVPAMLALTMVACGLLSWIGTFWSLPTAFLRGTAAAAGIAWINSIGNLGGHFGPDLIGRLREATGGSSTAAFLALAGLSLVGALIILGLPRPSSAPKG